MVLNYPPATVVNLFEEFDSASQREKARVERIKAYLNGKWVKEDDLLLIVDGQDTWFQLPSEVMIRQYQNVVADASKRLLDQYGVDDNGWQKFNQTIIFGAEKTCEVGEEMCKFAPDSPLPGNIYGKGTGNSTQTTPAKYLDAGMMMGRAKDLRKLYEAAAGRFGDESSAQSVFAAIFGEQQQAREAEVPGKKPKPANTEAVVESQSSRWFSWFSGPGTANTRRDTESAPRDSTREFSMGLDYTHTLFQTLLYPAEEELVPLSHDNSVELEKYKRPDTPTPPLDLPSILQTARPPFWTPDVSKHNPNPQDKPSYMAPLRITADLDTTQPATTSWAQVKLIQNTYTGAIPAIFHLNSKHATPHKHKRADPEFPPSHQAPDASDDNDNADDDSDPPTAPITWKSLWYSSHERALLRSYFRIAQTPLAFHKAAVGGDTMWDARGGRGGVWTAENDMWLPWGEIDGVCGALEQLERVFGDGKGVWLHETEPGNEEERLRVEAERAKKIEEEERRREEEERKKADEERKKKIQEEKEKADKAKALLQAEKDRKAKEEQDRKDGEERERKKQEQLNQQAQQEKEAQAQREKEAQAQREKEEFAQKQKEQLAQEAQQAKENAKADKPKVTPRPPMQSAAPG
jgi:hypothetical protein